MEELRIQHHRLEIENATDIIYVLCMERLRNNSQMHALHKHFEVIPYVLTLILLYIHIYIYIVV